MANKAAISSQSTSRPVAKPTNNITKRPRTVKSRKEDVAFEVPEFGVKDQRWNTTIGGATYTLKNGMFITMYENDVPVRREIIYAEGHESIFKVDILKENGNMAIPIKPIRFVQRARRVGRDNPLLQKYLWYVSKFSGNTDIFLEDKEAEAQIEVERYNLIDSNNMNLRGFKLSKLQAVANAMELILSPSEGEDSVRVKLRRLNDKNPQKLNEVIRSGDSELDFYAKKVFEKGFVTEESDNIVWVGPLEEKQFICEKPVGESVSARLASMLRDEKFKSQWLDIFTRSLNQ